MRQRLVAGRWLCALALLACLPAAALDPHIPLAEAAQRRYGIEQGLPTSDVVVIAQDQDGYLWLGAENGLTRFDGVRFTSYTSASTPGLPASSIRSLLAEPDGRLWVGTSQGLAVYEHGQFRTIPVDPALHAGAVGIHELALDAQGQLVAGTTRGLMWMREGRLVQADEGERPAASVFLDAQRGTLWAGYRGQAVARHGQDIEVVALPEDAGSATITGFALHAGKLWASSDVGLFVRDGARWKPAQVPGLDDGEIYTLNTDRSGCLWISTEHLLLRLLDGRVVERIERPDSRNGVVDVFEDREGNVWMALLDAGLVQAWDSHSRHLGMGQGLQDPVLSGAARDQRDGSLWYMGTDGVGRVREGRFETLIPQDRLPPGGAFSLLVEGGNAWVGTRLGVMRWQDGRLTREPALAPLEKGVSAILRDRTGRLWFGTTRGLFAWDGHGAPVTYAREQGLTDLRARVLAQTGDGQILVGTQNGLFVVDGARVRPLPMDGIGLSLPQISALYPLADGTVLVGVEGDASLLAYANGRWTRLDARHGIPAIAPRFIGEDRHGQLWVAGLDGVYRTPMEGLRAALAGKARTLQVQVIITPRGGRNGGQQDTCCNSGGGQDNGVLEGDTLWLPSSAGMVALDTRRDFANPVAPSTVIERGQVDEAWRTVMPGVAWDLPQRARDVRIEFSTLALRQPDQVSLRYRLRGYDQAWKTLEDPHQRSATYTNLPSGDYVFEVEGRNESGLAAAPATLSFRIAPYFHETPSFYLLLIAVTALAVLACSHWLTRRHRHQREKLEALVQQRTGDLRQANAQLEALSVTDPLTGLHNRRYLSRQIPLDLAFYDREHAVDPLHDALVFGLLDLDHFKRINDTYGHDAGDHVLQQVAQCLRELAREGDYVVRWGGEEFLLVFRPMPRAQLHALGERICGTIARHPFVLEDGRRLEVTVSLGLMEYPPFPDAPPHLGWEQMVALADRALYQVKKNGRNGWAAYRAAPGIEPIDLPSDAQPDQLIESGVLRLVGSRGAAP